MKLLFFAPIILFFAVFGLLIFGFLGFIAKMLVKTRNSSWTGEVIDKMHNTRRDDENPHKINHFYVLVVRPDGGGRDMKLGIAQQLYDQFEIGDKIRKDKGEMLPKKA